ncbi:U6 snRNA-associated Sm-like protein LSm4 like [Verticillium longisporum]|uniref:U6 snRNA-associated Sm-like protein LSm4 like n=1 Tax=Verticillium longisporum TaxID=100787 RepID=A0A8I2Z6T7_VERLO|nr:U6 snRNA-associated Sm-like protein LSm4 like [Verticillium longisporum]
MLQPSTSHHQVHECEPPVINITTARTFARAHNEMLPLGLLNAAQGHPMLEGDKFVKIPEVYVKGNNIKYLRVPDDIIDIVKENQQNNQGGFRGGRGGGRGDHRGGDRGRGRGQGRGRGRGRGA